MSNTGGLHMADVIDSIRRHKRIIVIITILTAITGTVFYVIGPKKYEGKTEFVVRNPNYSDRNNIYNYDTRYMDYFANDDDVDKVIVMSEADILQGRVIKNLHLAEAFHINITNRYGEDELAKRFAKNFNITRTEYKHLVLTYIDFDPIRAAAVANECVSVLDTIFSGYYREMRRNIYLSLIDKVHEEDSSIDALTDTLTNMRELYGINDIISPSRNNLMLGTMESTGNKNYPHGVEVIQNVESLKDQLVADRARQMTLVNQNETGIKIDQMPLLKVVTYAKIPVSPKGIGGFYTLLASGFLGFFFSAMLMSFTDKYFGKNTDY